MAYTNRTTFYRIPVMAFGDQMTAEQEMIQMGIIDSLLYAACFGCNRAILEEGAYSVQFSEDGTGAQLVISPMPSSAGYSLMGIVNGRMFYSQETLHIGRLVPNMTYYIYAEYTDALESNPAALRVAFYLEEQTTSAYKLPLCIVTTTPGAPVVDTDVDKPHAKNILAHTIDVTNPHGETLHQRNLEVINSLSVQGAAVHGAVYGTYTTQSGEYEWTPPAGKSPIFVHAYPESTTAGQIAWRISNGKVYFSNSGSAGVSVNIKVEVETTP